MKKNELSALFTRGVFTVVKCVMTRDEAFTKRQGAKAQGSALFDMWSGQKPILKAEEGSLKGGNSISLCLSNSKRQPHH